MFKEHDAGRVKNMDSGRWETGMCKEIINATQIARIIRCQPPEVRHKMRNNIWNFGRVVNPKNGEAKKRYVATITEVAEYIGISREEAIRRLNGEEG